MRYEEREPLEPLQPFVKCFWYLERSYGGDEDGEVLWPDGCQELIFHYGTSCSYNGQALPPAMFIGTLTHYHELKADGSVKLFGVRLLPWGLKAFADVSVPAFRPVCRFEGIIRGEGAGSARAFTPLAYEQWVQKIMRHWKPNTENVVFLQDKP